MSDKKNYGILMTGQPLTLFFSSITNPVTGAAYTDLSGVQMHFSVKRLLSQSDASAVATIKEDDTNFVVSGGELTMQLISPAISETLTPRVTYYFDGWLMDSNGIQHPINFNTAADPQYVGYFTVAQSSTRTKDLTA